MCMFVLFNVAASAWSSFRLCCERLMRLEELSALWVKKFYDLMSMGC